ncbi:uncharacterized protein [Mobula birostris]|uniref:uncharacterized protein n=1 Tax=Mobula birostris TaxID=1983395 RepID=UPI003B28BC76
MRSERPTRRHRIDSSIWLICFLTATLVITGICWRIQVSQIRQSMISPDRNYPPSLLDPSQRTCLKNLPALKSDLSVLKRMHADLRHQFTEIETKFRTVNETKAQICELLTSRKEQTCSKDWISNKDRCYYVSTFGTSFYSAVRECSNRDSRLLEIISRDEARFVSDKLVSRNRAYWIGKCEGGNVAWGLLYKQSSGTSNCKDCDSYAGKDPCKHDRRFICEKAAPLLPEIPEMFHDLCQQPVETT